MNDTGGKVAKSALFMLLLRLFQRSIGLISTLILARILIPEDFGIVAIVTIVGLFFNILTQTGSEQYIIQKSKVNDGDLDAAFTLDILTKFVIWGLFIIAVPWISDYYEEPSLKWALWVSSLALPIGALMSPKLYVLKRNIEFQSFAKLEGFRKIFSFSVVMLVVFFEPSYWAIVAGDIASIFFAVIGSYFIAPYRPKINKEKIFEQWAFSRWMLLKGIFGFARSQADTFLVSRFFGVADLGRYHMTKHIAYIPANDIIIPATEPVLSALSESKKDKVQFNARLSTGFFITFSLVFPISLFICFFPQLIVDFLLGEKWVSTYSIMSILGVAVLLTSLNHLFEISMISLAKVKQIFVFDVITMVALITTLWFFPGKTIEQFALHRTYLLVMFSLMLVALTYYYIRFDLTRMIALSLPVILATYIAINLVTLLENTIPTMPIFALSYVGSVYVILVFVISLSLFQIPWYKATREVAFVMTYVSKLKR
jgi:lipopolysaccharide exporter